MDGMYVFYLFLSRLLTRSLALAELNAAFAFELTSFLRALGRPWNRSACHTTKRMLAGSLVARRSVLLENQPVGGEGGGGGERPPRSLALAPSLEPSRARPSPHLEHGRTERSTWVVSPPRVLVIPRTPRLRHNDCNASAARPTRGAHPLPPPRPLTGPRARDGDRSVRRLYFDRLCVLERRGRPACRLYFDRL